MAILIQDFLAFPWDHWYTSGIDIGSLTSVQDKEFQAQIAQLTSTLAINSNIKLFHAQAPQPGKCSNHHKKSASPLLYSMHQSLTRLTTYQLKSVGAFDI